MKNLLSNTFVRTLIVIITACLIGVLAQTWKTVDKVPFCINAAGCNFSMEPKGKITAHNYGYPVSYRETSTFTPEHNDQNDDRYAGYAEATTEIQSFNGYNILINTVFWSALLYSILKLLSSFKSHGNKRQHQEDQSPNSDIQ